MSRLIVGEAWVAIRPDTSAFRRGVTAGAAGSAFGTRLTQALSASMGRSLHDVAQTSGNRWLSGFSTAVQKGSGIVDSVVGGVGRTINSGLVAAGSVAAGGLVAAVGGGVSRLLRQGQAMKQLEILGLTAGQSKKLIADMGEALMGTAFTMDSAASAASRLVGAGVGVDKVTDRVKLLMDASAFGGYEMDELARIMARVQGEGKLSARTLEMLTLRIPGFTTAMAEAAGVGEEEFRSMVSSGEINSEKFIALWEKAASTGSVTWAGMAEGMTDTTGGAIKAIMGWITMLSANFLEISGVWDMVGDGARAVLDMFKAGGPGDLVEGWAKRTKTALEPVADMIARIGKGEIDLSGVQGFISQRMDDDTSKSLAGAGIGALAGGMLQGAGRLPIVGAFLPALGPIASVLGAIAGLVAATPELRESFARMVPAVMKLSGAMGEALLGVLIEAVPLFITLADVAATALEWLADQAQWTAPAILAIAAAFKILNIVMSLNPFGQVMLAIAALVGLFILAYNKVDWFRAGVDRALRNAQMIISFVLAEVVPRAVAIASKAWEILAEVGVWLWDNALGPAFRAIATAAQWLFENVLPVVIKIAVTYFKIVAAIVTWLWKNVYGPAFRAIAAGAQWLFENVLPVVIKVVVGYFKILATVMTWLWKNVYGPALRGIAAVAQWLFENVLPVVINIVVGYFKMVAGIVMWLWNTIWAPAFRGIAAVVRWAWTTVIQPSWDRLMATMRVIGSVVTWLWNNAIKPAWERISAGIRFAWVNVIRPALIASELALKGLGRVTSWLWTNAIRPAWDAIQRFIRAAWTNFIRPAWDAVVRAAERVGGWMRSLWNNFIRPAWTSIQNFIRAAWERFIRPAWDAIVRAIERLGGWMRALWNNYVRPVWTSIRNHIQSAWHFIRDRVFNPIRTFVTETLPGAFTRLRDRLRDIWNGIRDTAANMWAQIRDRIASPVNWVINNVYGKLKEMVDKAAEKLGMSLRMPTISPIRSAPSAVVGGATRQHTGGIIPGEASDEVPFIGLGRERVLSHAEIRNLGGYDAIERAVQTGGFNQRQVQSGDSDTGDRVRAVLTSFWDAQTASGRPMTADTIAARHLPMGSRVRVGYGGKQATGTIWDLGPADFVQQRHGNVSLLDLAEPMMQSLTGSRSNVVNGWWELLSYGSGRSYRNANRRNLPDAGGAVSKGPGGIIGAVLQLAKPAMQKVIETTINPLIKTLEGREGGVMKDVMVAVVKKFVDGALDWVGKAEEESMASGLVGEGGDGSIMGWQRMQAWAQANLEGVRITSAYYGREGSNDFHGQGRALDMGFSDRSEYNGTGLARQAFNKIKSTFFSNIKELIWDFAGNQAVWKGRNHFFTGGSAGPGTHADHIHWAMREGGKVIDPGNQGLSATLHHGERVLTASQTKSLERGAGSGVTFNGPVTFKVEAKDMLTVDKFEKTMRDIVVTARNRRTEEV